MERFYRSRKDVRTRSSMDERTVYATFSYLSHCPVAHRKAVHETSINYVNRLVDVHRVSWSLYHKGI